MDNQMTPAVAAIESTVIDLLQYETLPLLAPCPFCGNAPKLLVRAMGYNNLLFIISCAGPCNMKEVSTGPYHECAACVTAWNGRANSGGTVEEAK